MVKLIVTLIQTWHKALVLPLQEKQETPSLSAG